MQDSPVDQINIFENNLIEGDVENDLIDHEGPLSGDQTSHFR